jgi:uncharacterized protein YabE (DUF348 family)
LGNPLGIKVSLAPPTKEYIYGPEKDLKINADGSTKKDIWTTPDKFKTKKEAIDKLDR